MRVIHSLSAKLDLDVVLTIGSFDGVHLGHQRLLRQLVDRARQSERTSAALTFHPHPRLLLRPEVEPAHLTSEEERLEILESLGLDLLVLLPFTRELADTPAEDFVRQLYDELHMRELWVGPGFAMGRRRGGDIARLRALSTRMGYVLRVFPPVLDGGQVISSTRIRNLLRKGRVGEAKRLLGRPYTLSGRVSHGARRGRCLGFRTANLTIDAERAVPADGVYVVWATVEGQRYQGVSNVGVRPSFGGGERVLEVHLLDYEDDLYGKHVTVEYVQWLRPEMRFDHIPALVEQVQRDIAHARAILTPEHVECQARTDKDRGVANEIRIRSASDGE